MNERKIQNPRFLALSQKQLKILNSGCVWVLGVKKRLCSSPEIRLASFSGPTRLFQLRFKCLKVMIQNGNIGRISNSSINRFINCPYTQFFPKGNSDFFTSLHQSPFSLTLIYEICPITGMLKILSLSVHLIKGD